MTSKVNSFDDKIKLPVTETVSRFYQQPQQNRKAIRILTVAVYVLCVSLAAIMLSLYYIFIWDPTVKPFMTKVTNCEKIIIPEQIAIRLTNYTEISADQFYKNILQHYQKIQRKNSRRINSYMMTSSALKRSNKIIENQSLTVGTISTAAAATAPAPAPTSTPASASTSNNTSKLEFDVQSYKSTIKSAPQTDITSVTKSDSHPRTAAITTVATTKIPTPKLIKNRMSRNHFNNNNNDFDNNENENDNLLLVEQPISSSSGLKMNLIKRIPHPAKRHKLSEYFIKSIKMHNSRRINNDDEDYSDSNEFDNDGDANDDDDNDDNMKNINIDEASGDYGYDDRNIRYNKYKNNKFIDIS